MGTLTLTGGRDSEVLASSYAPSIGFAFPESGVMQHLRGQARPADQVPFLGQTAWNLATVNSTTPGIDRGPPGVPVLTRLIVAPIRTLAIDNATGEMQFGELRGAVVIVRLLNGVDSVWEVDAFTSGFFGMILWDRYERKFRDVTSVLKTSDAMIDNVDITAQNPNLMQTGLLSQFNADQVVVQPDIQLVDQTFALSMVPFTRADEVVLSPTTTNAYVLRGLSQAPWNRVRTQVLAVQIFTMAVVVLSALIKVVLAWLPLRRFLNSLERVFTVQSVSDDLVAKRENAAVAMLHDGATVLASRSVAVPSSTRT